MTKRSEPKALAAEPSLVDAVTARTVGSARSGKNLAAVLALRAEIEMAVGRGFSIKAVHTTLVECGWAWLRKHGYDDGALEQLDMGYDTFRNLCKNLGIRKQRCADAQHEPIEPTRKPRRPHPKARPDGFVLPSAVTEEDLY